MIIKNNPTKLIIVIICIVTFSSTISWTMLQDPIKIDETVNATLPKEIYQKIASYLAYKDRCSLCLVCHQLNKGASIIVPNGYVIACYPSFIPDEKELFYLVKNALLDRRIDVLDKLKPYFKERSFTYTWASDFTYDWQRSPKEAVLSFRTLNDQTYSEIRTALSSDNYSSFLFPIMIDQEKINHLELYIKQKKRGWFSHNMELALWANKQKAFNFLSEHFAIDRINTYIYPFHLRTAVYKAKAYFVQEDETAAIITLQQAGFTEQFIARLVFKIKKFDTSGFVKELPAFESYNDFDTYISELSQAVQFFNPDISDYLARIPQILYDHEKKSCVFSLKGKDIDISNLKELITFFNKRLKDCVQEAAQHFLCCIGHVSYGNKTAKLISIHHVTFWLEEFLRRKQWKSSAKIFNLCKNFDTAIIKPLHKALEENDLITLRCLLVHIESIQHYFNCKHFQIMWIQHIILLLKAIKLERYEAFFLLQSLLLHYNNNCNDCTKQWVEHNKKFDTVWDIFNEKNRLCKKLNIITNSTQSLPQQYDLHNKNQLSDQSQPGKFLSRHFYFLALPLLSVFFYFFPWNSKIFDCLSFSPFKN